MNFAEGCVNQAAEDGISGVLFNRASGNLVSFMIAEDLIAVLADDAPPPPAELLPIFGCLGQLSHKWIDTRASQNLQPGEVIHVIAGGTSPHEVGRSVGYIFQSTFVEHAHMQGFKLLLVKGTNPTTQHIRCNKIGGNDVARLTVKDFV